MLQAILASTSAFVVQVEGAHLTMILEGPIPSASGVCEGVHVSERAGEVNNGSRLVPTVYGERDVHCIHYCM